MYDGEYNDDKKHGLGTYVWPDGKQYAGYWKNGKMHGQGRFTNASGKSRIGVWIDGERMEWLSSSVKDISPEEPNPANYPHKINSNSSAKHDNLSQQ